MPEFNIVGDRFDREKDLSLFLTIEEEAAGVTPSLIKLTSDDRTLGHLLTRLGKFSSVGEAKRNGWNKPIPTGWSVVSIGKATNRMDLFIWNPIT